jgi:translocation protein SEC63
MHAHDLQTSSEKAIKKAYRSLTLQYHPDKYKIDPASNETIQEVTDRYVEISKAYKALTDEEIRNNFVQYGHPDGKQSFSIGIALPKFIITDGNGKYVLMVYGLLLGVLLPYIVGKWWYGTQRMTKEKVLVASASKLFREYKDDITEGGIISALSSGEEYKTVLKGSKSYHGLGKIEKAILEGKTADSTVAGLTDKDQEKLANLEGVRRKTLALLWAYLGRVSLGEASLDDGQCRLKPNRA